MVSKKFLFKILGLCIENKPEIIMNNIKTNSDFFLKGLNVKKNTKLKRIIKPNKIYHQIYKLTKIQNYDY